MSQQHNEQPSQTPGMTQTTSTTASAPAHHGGASPARPEITFVRHASDKVLDSAEEEAGKKGVDYISANAPQDMDDMKAQAQGMWAKYCGCFSSLA